VAEFIAWWIDQATGLPIDERAGVLRWFRRGESDDKLIWADHEADLIDPADPDNRPLSVTFIPANIYDNTILMKRDPEYLRKLMQLPMVERARLLGGNWKIRPSSGLVFNRAWFDILDEMPRDIVARIRYWDKAGTPGSNSYAVGAKLAVTEDGQFIVEDIVRGQWLAPERNRIMLQTAKRDGRLTFVWVEQEPGSGGKESAEITIAEFKAAGMIAEAERVTGDKVSRAEPMSWQAERRNVKVLRGDWNEAWLAEMNNFPEGAHDDQVDASTGAFNKLKKLYDEVGELAFSDEDVDTETQTQTLPLVEIGENFVDSELFRR
jgi:predicted phage terminase large subunit-like protein